MTRRRLEKVLGDLEGGHALTYATGLAAVSAMMHFVKPTHVYIELHAGYFGTHDVIKMHQEYVQAYSPQVPMQILDLKTLHTVTSKPDDKARVLVWLETPQNPTCKQQDVAFYANIAKTIGATMVVDSTFGTPVLQKPLDMGADFVVHSTTKVWSNALVG